jgi:hypothetical protein
MTRSTINSRSIEGIHSIDATGTVTTAGLTVDTDTLHIDSTNNRVGIGTTSPATKAGIYGTAAAQNLALRVTNTAADGYSTLQLFDDQAGIYRAGSGVSAYGGASALNILTVGGHPITLGTSNTVRLTVDPSGNVGIGTVSPAATSSTYKNLQVALGATVIGRTDDTPLYLSSNLSYNNGWKYIANTTATQILLGTNIQFFNVPSGTAGTAATLTERMRIDTSGNLLIGTTSSTIYSGTTTGINLNPDGATSFNRASGQAAMFNRISTDGDIVQFRKDGTTVGSVGTNENTDLFIAGGDTGLLLNDAVDSVIPATATGSGRDNAIDLGYSTVRFKDLYLGGGVYLGGTGSANHLDDYEEGTWTPSAIVTYSSPTLSNISSTGLYVKIGKVVYCWFKCRFSTNGAGNIGMSGLPFAGSGGYNVGSCRENNATGNMYILEGIGGTSVNVFRRYDNNGCHNGTNEMNGAFMYETT